MTLLTAQLLLWLARHLLMLGFRRAGLKLLNAGMTITENHMRKREEQ